MEPYNEEPEDVVVHLHLGRRDQERLATLTRLFGNSEGDVLLDGLALLETVATHVADGGKVYRTWKGTLRRSELLLHLAKRPGQGDDNGERKKNS